MQAAPARASGMVVRAAAQRASWLPGYELPAYLTGERPPYSLLFVFTRPYASPAFAAVLTQAALPSAELQQQLKIMQTHTTCFL